MANIGLSKAQLSKGDKTGGGGGVSDGDKGDITVSGGGATWTIDPDVVTFAKMQNLDEDKLVGRDTVGIGDPEQISVGGGIEFTGAGSIQTSAFSGDVTKAAGGTVLTIPNNTVTYAKMQDVSATNRFLGRITAGAGDPEELTGTQATTLLDVFTSTLKGLVPASGGGTTNFLRADGTWTVPAGGGSNITRISGSSGAAGADITWQSLTTNSADVTTTTLSSSVMSTTNVGAGTWKFKYTLIYQTAATTTGIGFGINHTGTVSKFIADWKHITTGGAAATGIGDDVAATVAGQLAEGKSDRTLNAVIGSASAGVATANTNTLAILEGIIVVTATGTLELKIASEVAGSAVRIMANSTLELHKIA